MTKIQDEGGFSLIEMLVASALLTSVIGGVVMMLTSGQNNFEAQKADIEMRQRGRVALGKMVYETRLTGYGLGTVSSDDALSIATAQSIQFAANIDDGDSGGECDATYESAAGGGAERITYSLTGTQLDRDVDCWDGSTWTNVVTNQVVAIDLTAGQTLFRYFDGDGNELTGAGGLSAAQRVEVRSIAIGIAVINVNTTQLVGNPHANLNLTTQVQLHNMR